MWCGLCREAHKRRNTADAVRQRLTLLQEQAAGIRRSAELAHAQLLLGMSPAAASIELRQLNHLRLSQL
jgi:hypothetical protein